MRLYAVYMSVWTGALCIRKKAGILERDVFSGIKKQLTIVSCQSVNKVNVFSSKVHFIQAVDE